MNNIYCLANPNLRPINVIHDGSGPHIQTSNRVCETYQTKDEAIERLNYLLSQDTSKKAAAKLTVRRLTECGIVIN